MISKSLFFQFFQNYYMCYERQAFIWVPSKPLSILTSPKKPRGG